MIAQISHNESLGIWDITPVWSVQGFINLNFSCGDAIQGIGANFTLKDGVYKVHALIEFEISDFKNPFVIGHGLSRGTIDNAKMQPVCSDSIQINSNGKHYLSYEATIDQVEELYNVFILLANYEPSTLNCTKIFLNFYSL